MKKIAIPTREGMVDDHFGHCAYYTVVTYYESCILGPEGIQIEITE